MTKLNFEQMFKDDARKFDKAAYDIIRRFREIGQMVMNDARKLDETVRAGIRYNNFAASARTECIYDRLPDMFPSNTLLRAQYLTFPFRELNKVARKLRGKEAAPQ